MTLIKTVLLAGAASVALVGPVAAKDLLIHAGQLIDGDVVRNAF